MRWGDYAPAEIPEAGGGKTSVRRRIPYEAVLTVSLGGDAEPVVRDVSGSGGLELHVVERPIGAMGTDGAELPAGTRSPSCFLVNRRTPAEAQPDCAYAFQAEIEVRADGGFVPRPDLRGAHAAEWDDQGRRLPLRRHAGVRDRAQGLGRMGFRGRRVPSRPHRLGWRGRGGEDDGRRRARGRAVDGGPGTAGRRPRGGAVARPPRLWTTFCPDVPNAGGPQVVSVLLPTKWGLATETLVRTAVGRPSHCRPHGCFAFIEGEARA